MRTGDSLLNPQRFCVRIADLTVALMSEGPGLTLGVDDTINRFVVDETVPDVHVRAAWGDLSDDKYKGGEKLFDSGGFWQLYAESGSYRFSVLPPPAFSSSPYSRVVSFHRDFTAGEVTLHRPYCDSRRPVYPLQYPLDELLVINLLASGRGVELHACGVVDAQGKGHLFFGQSGAGKSTMARLWQRHGTVLSDDRIILRERGNRLWMYGTPWHGEAAHACPLGVPLTGLFFLRQGQSNALTPQRSAEAVARLFVCSFPPFYSRDGLDFTLRFFERVVKSVPCYELRFLPDVGVVEFISGLRDELIH